MIFRYTQSCTVHPEAKIFLSVDQCDKNNDL